MSARRAKMGLLSILLLLAPLALWAATSSNPVLFGDGDRLLVLAPHPGDETLATGGLIQEAIGLDLPIRICFFTMGDNNEVASLFTRNHPSMIPGAMRSSGRQRHKEALAASQQLGVSTNDVVFLGYPDSGTLDIWQKHWREIPPYRSPLTRANAVPYQQALTPGSAHAGEDILDDLEEVIRDFQPTHIAVSHPADHNVDHRALYLFTRVVLWNLAVEGFAPQLLVYPAHFTQWPQPRGLKLRHANAAPYYFDGQITWQEYVLAPFQVSNKLAAIRRHHSQYQHAAAYVNPLIRRNEWFGDFDPIALPDGQGQADIVEEDATHFHIDPALLQELSRDSDQWAALMDQHAKENQVLAESDNSMIHRTITGDGTSLTLTFQFLHPVETPSIFTISLYGYRFDTSFGEMPKIEIESRREQILAVRNLKEKLPKSTVRLIPADDDQISVSIPFEALGNPQKICFGARLTCESLPVDWVSWRLIDLESHEEELPPPEEEIPADALEPDAPSPAPELTESETPPPPPQPALVPRISLPRKPIRAKTEADEPVFW